MAATPSFNALMARLRAGDDDAAAELLQRFATRLIALAQARLDKQIRRKVDPEDVLQSVFRSFFVRHADREFDLRDWGGLWALLVTLTLRKCGHQVRDLRRARQDVRREVAAARGESDSNASWEALAHEPTPAEAAMLAEAVEQLLLAMGERDRPILELRLQGYTVAEISERVGRTEYSVEAVLKKARKRLQQLGDEPLRRA
jgi:RNA polymerase sigma-70 factor (ECF subfamily)